VPIVSVALGGAITWGVSRHYYQQAARGLTEETDQLKRALEQGGTVRFERDENGNLTRVIVDIGGAASGSAGGGTVDINVG
jgi:hypothetical protein